MADSYNTSRQVLVGPINALALVPFLVLLIWHSWPLFYGAIAMASALWYLAHIRWTLPVLFRFLLSKIAGRKISHRVKIINKIVRY